MHVGPDGLHRSSTADHDEVGFAIASHAADPQHDVFLGPAVPNTRRQQQKMRNTGR